ncbi:hypothetical protein BDV38DRAFT_268238 [Aspergillus pseudotamarii]|uniref:Enoyl reductase (ER) domain-containing protein n=1 Tax=Aspergillus pseudotamarii TaxID=132259 RepID=A0A5N6T6T0_ASPPS|nr:uncharacterized protein BDV38DRAFT_268238 [Aspergillus pseudotamarii]KAE8141980.1 hypothetical protein BDV38DRAFT_268238 [Aspergillus pseudotamarii]
MTSPKAQTKHPPVIQKLERLGDRSWRRDSMLYSLTSFLWKQPSLQAVDTRHHTVWLFDNTAYLRATPVAKGQKESWHAEVVACVFRRDSRKDMSKIVAMIADLIGLDGEIGTEREIRHQIARRLQPFLYHVMPAHLMMLEIPQPNSTTIIQQLGPTNSNGISSQVVNMGGGRIADGNIVRSYLRGSRGNIAMQTYFAGPKGWLVISDIDDTIKYTKTSESTGILRTTFVEEPRPIAGMPELYSHMHRELAPAWFYVSASPYNLYPFLRTFIHTHFNPGTLILRDSSWLDVSELVKSFTVNTMEYKDPEAYAEIYKRHPHWIRAIWIRKVTDVPHLEDQNSPERFEAAFEDVPDRVWKVFEQPEAVFDFPAKPFSTTMDEQTFVPKTMRALYHRPASTAITDQTALDAPRVDSGIIFDTDFPVPKPAANQYLIKIQTAAFSHDGLRLARSLHPSKSIPQIPLHNYCGIVISTPTEDHDKPDGPKFKVADTVFGLISNTRDGAAADYIVATEDEIALKPKNISAAEASTIPGPALTAWQALFTYGGLDPSDARRKLRVLVTNARDNEVAAQALQLLRARSLFPHHRPWICTTCSCPEHDDFLRDHVKVDEVIDAALPLPQDFDLAEIFRKNKWDPVDVILDCAGEQMFSLAHSSDVVKNNGVVLTAVDDTAVQPQNADREAQTQKHGLFSRFVALKPDGKALARIAELVEEGSIRGRVQSIVDLAHGVDVLAAEAAGAGGGRRGGMMVFRVNI